MSKLDPVIENFIKNYTKALEDKTAAVFAGAGLSQASGFVNWKILLKDIVKGLKLDIDQDADLVAVAQYHINENSSRHRINQLLVDQFQRKAKLTENHKLLANLPIGTYWTTNYDILIEQALRENGKTPDVKISPENLPTNLSKRDAVVYKMHGDISLPHKAIITKDDYEKYDHTHNLFSTALKGDLVTKTFLFIGFSFNDPNIDYILSRVRVLLGDNQREHYCFMRKVQRKDFDSLRKFSHAKVSQELQIKDLKRFNIQTLLFNDFSDFTNVLRLINSHFKRSKIFVSGSAVDYGVWKEKKSVEFLHKLGKDLASNECPIITGFGVGVGSAIINGALEHIFSTNYRHIEDYLILRPFPQFATGKQNLKSLWLDYRNTIIPEAGIAIFVFGNKSIEGKIVEANGVLEEFEIAVKKGLKVIPVGLTGSVSQKLWGIVSKNKNKYLGKNPKVHRLFNKLNNPRMTPSTTVKTLVSLIHLLQLEY